MSGVCQVFALWWRYRDGSGCGVERVYWSQKDALADMEMLDKHITDKEWTIEAVPLLSAREFPRA